MLVHLLAKAEILHYFLIGIRHLDPLVGTENISLRVLKATPTAEMVLSALVTMVILLLLVLGLRSFL